MKVGNVLAAFRALPVMAHAGLIGRNFAVLAPHPDDESLGCGGVIAEACAAGCPPHIIILTDGAASHPGSSHFPPEAVAALRAEEAVAAVSELGVPRDRLHFLHEPDGHAPHDADGLTRAASAVAGIAQGCDAVLVTWRHDPHGDHVSAQKIARRAATALGARLLEYPVWGWTLPVEATLPDTAWQGGRVEISAHLAAKRAAIRAHRSQHGAVITDDPTGFTLPDTFLALFDTDWEIFVEAPG